MSSKCIMELKSKCNHELMEEKDSIILKLSKIGSPDALALRGIIELGSRDTINGMENLGKAADSSSSLAAIMLAQPDWKGELRLDKDKLEPMADRFPVLNKLLGSEYLVSDADGKVDKKRAAYYLLRAEKYAMLSKKDAEWLLTYYKEGGDVQLSEEDVRRLKAFIGLTDD